MFICVCSFHFDAFWVFTVVSVMSFFSFGALTLLVGQQEGQTACKKLDVGLLVVTAWNFARLIALVVLTTTSVILSSNIIQNRDVLVPAKPDPSGKWPLKQTESVISLMNSIHV